MDTLSDHPLANHNAEEQQRCVTVSDLCKMQVKLIHFCTDLAQSGTGEKITTFSELKGEKVNPFAPTTLILEFCLLSVYAMLLL